MSAIIHHQHCPVCGSATINEVLRVVDRTVSKETFALLQCSACSLRFTQDIPTAEAIGPYYKSENYISHTATKKGLINSLYHFVRRRTIARKRQLIKRLTGVQSGSILDIGSGTGTFAANMKEHGWKATGLEPDENARRVARDEHNIELAPMEQLDLLESGSFDAITMWHVLEHVHQLHHYMDRLRDLLKTGGKLFIAVPNYTATDATKFGEYWAAYDVPRHLYHFSPKSMRTLLEMHGMQLEKMLPMYYDSVYISLLSSGYKNGKVSWPQALGAGLRSNLKALGDTQYCSSIIYVIGK